MAGERDGGPERLGRLLGRAVVQGRVVARQLADPATREQLGRAGLKAAERTHPKVKDAADRARQELAARGPDVAEQVTQRAVERILWALGGRSAVLMAAVRPLAQPVRNAAGTLARDMAQAAGGGKAPASTAPADLAPTPLAEASDEAEAGSAGGESPASST